MLVGQRSLQQNLESFYQYPISTAGSAVLSQEDVQDLSLVSSPTDFHIVDYSLYLGKRILILKPQLQAGINIVVDSAPPFFSTSTGFTSTFPIPEVVGTSIEFAFSSTEIAVSGGSGGAFPPSYDAQASRVLYVSIDGDDATGDGGPYNPFLTIQHALNTITGFGDASYDAMYKIILSGGLFVEDINVIPYVCICSYSAQGTRLQGHIEISQLDSVVNSVFFMSDIDIVQEQTWDIAGFSNSPIIGFKNCIMISNTGNLKYTGCATSIFILENCDLRSVNIYFKGGGFFVKDTHSFDYNEYLEFDDTGGAPLHCYLDNLYLTKSDTHFKCSNSVGSIFQMSSCGFEAALRIDHDVPQLSVIYDTLPASNNFDGIASAVLTRNTDCFSEGYNPSNTGNWSTVPNNVKYALDTVADASLYKYTPSVPGNWSNSFSLITPTNLDSALNVLANNMNERYASRYRIQNLNATSTFGFNGLNNSDLLTLGVGSITLGGTGTMTLSSTAANTVMTSGTTMNITSGTGMSVNSGGNLTVTSSGGITVLSGTSTSINCTTGNMSISTNSTTGNNNLGSSANTSGTTNITSGFNISMQIVNGSSLLNGSMVRGKGVPSSTTTSNSFFGASDGVTLANASLVTFYSPTHLYYALPATNSAYTVDVIANLSDNANPLNFFTARITAVFGSAGVSYTIIDQTTTYTYQQGFVPPVSAMLTASANAISVSFTHVGYTCRPKASWEWMKVA